MRSNSIWKETAEKEIFELLAKTFGQNDIQIDPNINNKKADFFVRSAGIYVEVKSVKDMMSDILEIVPYYSDDSMKVKLIDKGQNRKKLLDRLASKIQEECKQLPEIALNVLVVKTEERYLSPYDVVNVFMEQLTVIDRRTSKIVQRTYRSHFRNEEERREVLKRISAIIAYKDVCEHGRLRGISMDNQSNAGFPLSEKVFSSFERMICSKCSPTSI